MDFELPSNKIRLIQIILECLITLTISLLSVFNWSLVDALLLVLSCLTASVFLLIFGFSVLLGCVLDMKLLKSSEFGATVLTTVTFSVSILFQSC